MSTMTEQQRDFIINLSQRLHGHRSGDYLRNLRTTFPTPTKAQASHWITTLKEQVESDKPTAVIFDYDGTLCDVRTIRHYVENNDPKSRNFDAFHRASAVCPPNPQVLNAAHTAKKAGHTIIGVTARRRNYWKVTSDWNTKHDVPVDHLLMRPDDDTRPDYDVKRDLLARIRERYNVIHAVDDNPSVIRLWQEEGIETTIVPGFGDPTMSEGDLTVTNPFTAPTTPANTTATDVPAGRYAIPNDDGALAFYHIQRPTKGRWSGYTFVNVLAGDSELPVRSPASRAILKKIAANPQEAMADYGRHLGVCGRCNRTLTDEASRSRGLGPECATKG